MLSIDYELAVTGFKVSEIGPGTLVRVNRANLQINVTNDGSGSLYSLNVKPVLESYVGQDNPILFLQQDAQVIDQIASKAMVPLTFSIWANYPGLVAVAIYVTDATGSTVMAKRPKETAYEQSPVRYWFYVVDNISVQTLRALKALAAQKPKEMER